ncbi:hypothetical protein NLU13_6605 [Sarocladium strictum]|uniref:DUF1446-domain-containing protein n=1 Tax=Sarocladium strictum TaxID=5046 RepID=A0AA39GHT1_SARSR|nr:hypothetical protein NLU13_6605 [Sarocladium strictum]
MPSQKRAIRIAGASGGFSDRQRSYHDLAKYSDVDVIIGDHLSECTITINQTNKVLNKRNGTNDPLFDPSFIGTISPCLPYLQQNNIKLAVNAGASDAAGVGKLVMEEVARQGLTLKVAWIEGDDVSDLVPELHKQGEEFINVDTGKKLSDWDLTPTASQCYLGGLGIAEALRNGADIVICGRVSDAAPVIGAATWWHGWTRDNLDELASALVAGHVIECSAYACGAYYSGFKDLFDNCEDLGFPIAAIEANGDTVYSKEERGTGGEMSVGTVTSQLVYEIQGPLYYNSDVTAKLEDIRLEQIGKNQVRMTGVKGTLPPPTTKLGISGQAGYQAEFHYLFCGLDIEKKAEWTERQIRYSMRNHMDKFSKLRFHLVGSSAPDPKTQDSCTVDFRIFVQTKDPAILGAGNWASLGGPESFTRWCMQNFLQSAPGASVVPDCRQAAARPFNEYWPTILPQSVLKHQAVLGWSGETIPVPPPTKTEPFVRVQRSYDTTDPVDLSTFGPTTRGPLGWVVMGRSGDKASNANVGFFCRHADEWDWLRSMLSTQKMIDLLGEEYLDHGIERFEMPHIGVVHFLIRDHLDGGFNSTSSLDSLGKNLCEFLRAKHVDIPNKFLDRGKI